MTKKLAPPNYTQMPNVVSDHWLCTIDSLAELKIIVLVMRQTFGWHCDRAKFTISDIQRMTGLARASVVDGLKKARAHGYLTREVVGDDYFYSVEIEQDTSGSNSEPPPVRPPVQKVDRASSEARPRSGSQSEPSPYIERNRSNKPNERKSSRSAPPIHKRDYDAITRRVFTYWQETFKDVLDTNQYHLTGNRKRMIGQRLRSRIGWTEQDLLDGIQGLRLSTWHMAQHRDNATTLYLDPKYVFEDDDKLEKFVNAYRVYRKDFQGKPAPCHFCDDSGVIRKPAVMPSDFTPVPEGVWQKTLAQLSQSGLSAETFETWFARLRCIGVNCDKVYLTTPEGEPGAVIAQWINTNFAILTKQAIAQNFGKEFDLAWIVEAEIPCDCKKKETNGRQPRP